VSLLATYMNDHLAGSTAGRELARRLAASNRGSERFGPPTEQLAREVQEDREALLAMMGALEVGVDRAKVVAGWAAEKVGRVKLNGRLFSYSPLSRLLELEGLTLGVRGKLAIWEALLEIGSPRRSCGASPSVRGGSSRCSSGCASRRPRRRSLPLPEAGR
jgi:hypothetical protein